AGAGRGSGNHPVWIASHRVVQDKSAVHRRAASPGERRQHSLGSVRNRLCFRFRLDALRGPHPGSDSDICRGARQCCEGDIAAGDLFIGAGSAISADFAWDRTISQILQALPYAHACAGSCQRRTTDRAGNSAGGWKVYDHLELFVVPEPVRSLIFNFYSRDEQESVVKRDPVVIIVVAMVVTVMLVFGIQKVRRNPGQVANAGPNMKGQAAPDFTLESLEGKTVRLSDFRGKGVLLN